MTTVTLNKPIPQFSLPATDNKTIDSNQLKGQHVVLYFYPKDNTPGCTMESKDFRDHMKDFEKLNTRVIGVSRDSLSSHEKFRESCQLPFELISDEKETLCKLFDVIKKKNMYGKEVMGIERSTFLIDKNGVLRKEWRGVKVDGHVKEVLEAVKGL